MRPGKHSHAGTPEPKSTTRSQLPATLERGPEPKVKKPRRSSASAAEAAPEPSEPDRRPSHPAFRLAEAMANAEGIRVHLDAATGDDVLLVDYTPELNDGFPKLLMLPGSWSPVLLTWHVLFYVYRETMAPAPAFRTEYNHRESARQWAHQALAALMVRVATPIPAAQTAAEDSQAFDDLDAIVQDLCGRIGIHPLELMALRYGNADCARTEPDILEGTLRRAVRQTGPLGEALHAAGVIPEAAGEWLDRGLHPMLITVQRHDAGPLMGEYEGEPFDVCPRQAVWRGSESSRWWMHQREEKHRLPGWMRTLLAED